MIFQYFAGIYDYLATPNVGVARWITNTPTVTFTIDQTQTSDALLLAEFSKQHTTDALLLAEYSKTQTSDALFLAEQSKSHIADSLIFQEVQLQHDTDSFLLLEQSINHSTASRILFNVIQRTNALLAEDYPASGDLTFTKFSISGSGTIVNPPQAGGIKPSGRVFYKDDYDQFYEVEWETVNGLVGPVSAQAVDTAMVDITTTIKQPYVWGQEPKAFIKNNTLFRYGVITIKRQIIRYIDGGYEIVAEGLSQYLDYIQMNFNCETGPKDEFIYHLNSCVSDDIIFKTTDGPHWADPDDPNDTEATWGTVDPDGSPGDLTLTGGAIPLEWIDVWN